MKAIFGAHNLLVQIINDGEDLIGDSIYSRTYSDYRSKDISQYTRINALADWDIVKYIVVLGV